MKLGLSTPVRFMRMRQPRFLLEESSWLARTHWLAIVDRVVYSIIGVKGAPAVTLTHKLRKSPANSCPAFKLYSVISHKKAPCLL